MFSCLFQPGQRSLLLKEIISDHVGSASSTKRKIGETVKRKHLTPAQQMVIDLERQNAIDMYRHLKGKRQKFTDRWFTKHWNAMLTIPWMVHLWYLRISSQNIPAHKRSYGTSFVEALSSISTVAYIQNLLCSVLFAGCVVCNSSKYWCNGNKFLSFCFLLHPRWKSFYAKRIVTLIFQTFLI